MTDDEYNVKEVNKLLEARYGITSADCGEEIILGGLQNDMTYDEIVEYIAQKYDLTPLEEADE